MSVLDNIIKEAGAIADTFNLDFMGGLGSLFRGQGEFDPAGVRQGPGAFDGYGPGTAEDVLRDLGGNYESYSMEDLYNDLLNQDYDAQVDFLRSQGFTDEQISAYTGAMGGTGPQTDETRAGEPPTRPTPPAERPAYTPDQPTPDAAVELDFDPADLLYAGDSELGDLLSSYEPETTTTTTTTTPPAETETETTSSATVGTTTPAGGSRTYAGIPEEILDRIQVGLEIPIPGPGNSPLPIIFGTVGEFIDWVQSVGIDPTTGNPDDFMGTVGRVLGDVFTTTKDAFESAVKGATTGQTQRFEDFVRDMIKAGTFDAGVILNAARDQLPDIFAPPSGAPSTPPASSNQPTTPGSTDTQLPLPGGEEEDDDDAAPAETAAPGPDVDSEGVPTDVGTQDPAEPQGPPADDGADDVGPGPADDADDISDPGPADDSADDLGTVEDDTTTDDGTDDLGSVDDDTTTDDTDRRDLPGTEDDTQPDDLGRDLADFGYQYGLPGMPGMGLRASIPEEAEPPEGIDLYDWLSIFRNLEQQQSYASPYAEGGEVEEEEEEDEYSALELAHPRIQAEALAIAEEFGLDPEQVAAGMMVADLEFQADVAAHFGPFGRAENIDPSRARMIPGVSPLMVRRSGVNERGEKVVSANKLLGFYVPEGVSDEAIEAQQELIDAYARMEGVEPVTIERDMVYGVGAKGATPETFAHEFRHRTFADIPFDRSTEENLQRFLDMLYSSDPERYATKSRMYEGLDFEGDADSLMGEFLEGKPTAMGRVIGELVRAGKVDPNDLYPEPISMLEELFGTSEPTAEELMRRLRAPENTARGRMTREKYRAKYRDNE